MFIFPSVSVLLVLIPLYLVPLLVAYGRRHPRRDQIALLSLLLGWFPLVWLGALIWALSGPSGRSSTSPAGPG